MWLFYFFFLSFVFKARTTPSLTIPDSGVVTLPVKGGRQVELLSGITCAGGLTRAFKRSISPSVPCGICFQIWPSCDSGTGYCLVFNPEGTLNYASASSYIIQVECTDDVTSDIKPVEVRLQANTPPYFIIPNKTYTPFQVTNVASKRAGAIIFDVSAADPDGDAVFYSLASNPNTDLFEIGYTDGVIRATNDMRLLCSENVDLYVSAFDSYNSPVGPNIIGLSLKGGNIKPDILNTETVKNIAEDPEPLTQPVAARDVLAITFNDDTVYSALQWKLRAVPERGLEYYTITTGKGTVKIRTRGALDYEYADLRSVMLCVDAFDGFCAADTFCVTVEITDVNEPPDIVPDSIERSVYEGFITLDPGWTVDDPDIGDAGTWVMTKDGGKTFHVDQDNGVIYSTGEFDVDPKTVKVIRYLEVEVRDKQGVKDTGKVKLTIYDKNDNVPVFSARLYQFSASPCTKVGAMIGQIYAKDDDSEYQGNDQLVFWGGGANISVLSTGDVVLKSLCTVGQTESITGYVTDQGTYPGPLEGVPCTIEFRCNECPSPVTAATTTQATTTLVPDLTNKTSFWDGNLTWIVPAIVLGVVLLSLLAYLLYRCCHYGLQAFPKPGPRPPKSQTPTRVKPKPAEAKQAQKPKPEVPKKRKPTPPPPLPPDNEPFFFGFWKETFPDRDQLHPPQRQAVPASVAQDRKVQEKEEQETEKEKEARRKERQRVEEEHQQQVQKYRQQLIDMNGPAGQSPNERPPMSASKKGFCVIL